MGIEVFFFAKPAPLGTHSPKSGVVRRYRAKTTTELLTEERLIRLLRDEFNFSLFPLHGGLGVLRSTGPKERGNEREASLCSYASSLVAPRKVERVESRNGF